MLLIEVEGLDESTKAEEASAIEEICKANKAYLGPLRR